MNDWQKFGVDVSGLMGRRLRMLAVPPTISDAAPPAKLHGVTDVIAIEDGVAADLTVRVHPVEDPTTRADVRYDQLALYDDPHPWRRFPYDTVGLTGTTLRLLTAIPTDGVAPVDLPAGIVDVTCLDDTTSVFLWLRVHPVDDPHTVALIRYEQLALHDDQPATSHSARHPLREHATGLTGQRMRLTARRTIDDTGDPQDDLPRHTDVICLDDTPGAIRSLRIHPLGDPDTITVVGVDQLAVYHHQP